MLIYKAFWTDLTEQLHSDLNFELHVSHTHN